MKKYWKDVFGETVTWLSESGLGFVLVFGLFVVAYEVIPEAPSLLLQVLIAGAISFGIAGLICAVITVGILFLVR